MIVPWDTRIVQDSGTGCATRSGPLTFRRAGVLILSRSPRLSWTIRSPISTCGWILGTAWEITRRLIDTVAACQGVITLLWHNTTLFGEQLAFYEKILN